MRPPGLALALLLTQVGSQQPPRPVIRSSVTYVSTDVVVRDARGQFASHLRKADFEVSEDGVRQEIADFSLTHGGRLIVDTPAQPSSGLPGLLLPPPRPVNDASGRVFLIFVDDLHFEAQQTMAVKALLHRMVRELIHSGDLVAMVSSGYSSIALDLTYDQKRVTTAINRVLGSGLSPSDIIGAPEGAQGPVEVRHRAHTAFRTAYDVLQGFEQLRNRRKAVLFVSNGYDFDPYAKSRKTAAGERLAALTGAQNQVPDANPFSSANEFAAADLAAELAELTREAVRANTTFYTFDPRGLVAGPSIDQTLDTQDWHDHVRETQSSLRVIAELTGGFAAINTNDFGKALKRVDNETSDYYVIGYYSNNPDPLKKRRTIEIRVKGSARYQLTYNTSYTLKPR